MISRQHQSENASGVPEISRGLSDQRKRYPRSVVEMSCTLTGCQHRPATRTVLRSLQDREIFLHGFRGCRVAQPPANFPHPSGMELAP